MDRSNLSLDRIRTFVRIAERGSLSAVARELGLAQPTVTRQLNELEAAIGVSLLSRSTRRVVLTEEGRRFYASSLQILTLVDEAADEAAQRHGAAEGTIRISCTAALGIRHICRLLSRFQQIHPKITIDLSLTDERIDLVREGVDIAIRLGPLSDSRMKLRSLGRSARLLVAAPNYLSQHGRPKSPADLMAHDCIRMSNIAGSELLDLIGPGGEHLQVPFTGRIRVDHGLAVRELLLHGQGIAAAHWWLVGDLLDAKLLEAVLPEYEVRGVPLNMLILPERAKIHRVRLVIDFLADQVGALPGIAR